MSILLPKPPLPAVHRHSAAHGAAHEGREGQWALQENRTLDRTVQESCRRTEQDTAEGPRGDGPAIEIPCYICSTHPAGTARRMGTVSLGPSFVRNFDPLPPSFLFFV